VPEFISTISNTAYQRANSHPLVEGSIIIHLAYPYSAVVRKRSPRIVSDEVWDDPGGRQSSGDGDLDRNL
jgi:hypothetical protein